MRRAMEKDPDAFTELMQEEMLVMYKTARSILRSDEDSADAIQDTILACWEHMDSLKETRYFRTWMTRILIRKCSDIIRKGHDVMTLPENYEVADKGNEYERVEWAALLWQIDPAYRIVLVLYYLDGFRTTEIAQILGINENTVRTRLARGREHLKAVLEEDKQDHSRQSANAGGYTG